jgi:hypothetical protein
MRESLAFRLPFGGPKVVLLGLLAPAMVNQQLVTVFCEALRQRPVAGRLLRPRWDRVCIDSDRRYP